MSMEARAAAAEASKARMFERSLPKTVIEPRSLLPAEFLRSVFAHVLEPGVHWTEALLPEYWALVAAKFSPGTRVEVYAHDKQVAFEMIVLNVAERSIPIRIDAAFRAIYPADLPLPRGALRRFSRYNIMQLPTGDYGLVDKEAGDSIVKRFPTRAAAGDALLLIEQDSQRYAAERSREAEAKDGGLEESAAPARGRRAK